MRYTVDKNIWQKKKVYLESEVYYMKTRKIRLLSALLALAMLLALLPTAAFADNIVAHGTCGAEGNEKNVTWTLDSNGTLTISGTGAMEDYGRQSNQSAPWRGKNIINVVIGDGVTTIGKYAFQDCTNLKNVTFPSSIETIEKWAFYGCVALESVDLSHLNDLEQIKNNAFNNCAALKTVKLPQNGKLNTIGVDAFSFTNSQPAPQITEITIPASVTTIGDGAFEGCSKLKKVTFAPDSKLQTIGTDAFGRCHKDLIICYSDERGKQALTKAGVKADKIKPAKPTVNFDSNKGTTVDSQTVANGEKVTEPTIKPTRDGWDFAGWYTKNADGKWADEKFDFSKAITDDMTLYARWTASGTCGANLTWILDSDGTLTISGTGAMKDYDFYVGERSPWDSKKGQIQNVVIGDGVTTIGKDAFNYSSANSELKTVDLSNATSLEKIGIRAFFKCSQLENIDLSKAVNLKEIGDNAFNSSGVENVTFPQNSQLTEIGSGVFTLCNNLKNIDIPETVTKIGGSAFERTGLTSIKIPASVTNIGGTAFYLCGQLESVTFAPDSKLEAIGGDAFSGCSALKTISCESALKEKLSGVVDKTKVKIIVTHWNVNFVTDDKTTTTPVENNTTVAELTAPAKDGYIFAGWYTKDESGKWADKPFDFSKAITDDTTLYARWGVEATPIGPATQLYPITIDYGTAYDAEGNPITKAAAGETVYVEASETALDGMTFERWEVRKGDVTLENDRAAKTSFTMPDGMVQLEAMYQAADVEDSGWDAATVVTGVAVGTGTAILAYHIGMEVYAEQVLGKDVAVPRTRAEVALLAWQLAGSPAVNAEGEPLSEAAQAERWAVESGLMQKDAQGNFNGTKKMSKWSALRTLDAAKKMG